MAFVSESSSSGFYFPRLLLKQSGVDLSDLSEYSFLHAHSAVAYAVLTRRYDAGAAYKGILDRTEFVHEKQQFRVIGLTEIIRNEPIVIRDDFPSELAESVRNAFLKVAEEEVISQVKNLTGFVPVEDSDYDSVRRLMSYAE
jgi:phosphonate transport system substrate-binding protein